MAPPARLRWFVRHGVTGRILRAAAADGDPVARLTIDRSRFANPYGVYETIRDRGPLARGARFYATADHALAEQVLRSDTYLAGVDSATAPRAMRLLLRSVTDPQALGPLDPPSMLVTNPPDHTRYRALVTTVFTARAIAALSTRIEQLADELLDDLTDLDTPDLIERYAYLLPVAVLGEVLALPADVRSRARHWGNAATELLDIGMSWPAFRRADRAVRELNDWLRGHFAALRAHPGDDLLSRLVAAADEEGVITEEELMAIAGLVLVAGYETTVNLIGNGVMLLLEHPGELAALRADPAGWPNAVEEILRLESPVQSTLRLAAAPTELAGQQLAAGAIVAVFVGGANRDPAVFADPTRFDIRRENAREHLAFSRGAHFCLGAHLARAEGKIALRALFTRYPDLALAGEPTRRPTRTLRGWSAIPVELGRR